MSWARFDDNMATHPKCAPLGDVAFRLMVHANLWSRAQRTGGFVPRDMLPTILPGRSRAKLEAAAEELVRAGRALHQSGLWEPDEGGWRIHDFGQYGNQNAADARVVGEPSHGPVDPELSRKRAEAGRRGGQVSGVVRSRTEAPVAPTALASAPLEPAENAGPKQIARSLEANGTKQNASSAEAIEIPILDPDSIPEPNPHTDIVPLLSPEANEQKPKQTSHSNPDAPSSAETRQSTRQSTPIGDRAKSYLRSSRAAEAAYGSPLDWPELQAVWRTFETTWGKADRPRDVNDPRVRVVLERLASGRTLDELSRAIRASKRYAPVAENPSYQRIKTILKDDEQIDNLLRLPDAAATRPGRVPLKQQGGWTAPMTERLDHA
jgi:hypothetical protein